MALPTLASTSSSLHSRKRVSYYHDLGIGGFHYGKDHPMKPHRIAITHSLISSYGLSRKMKLYRPHLARESDMVKYHSEDYIRFLMDAEANAPEDRALRIKYKVGEDCPIFTGMYQFCRMSAGGSLGGAVGINKGQTDIAINWAGGLHHAKKGNASGFCYVNDINLAILELLKYHQRVLYVDIDIHHGDGVEEAFLTTDRVMTVSFHKYGLIDEKKKATKSNRFFPGTGRLTDVGAEEGKYYAVNFPLKDGITDEVYYESVFKPVITKVMESYQPSCVVLQCGADSLAGDRLGSWNLTLNGHGKCVEFIKNLNLPLMLLGGGGYTTRNVARCWTHETAVALGVELPNVVPNNDYTGYLGADFLLNFPPKEMTDENKAIDLEKIKIRIFENLKNIAHAPSVQMMDIPEDGVNLDISKEKDEDEERNPDVRVSILASDKMLGKDNEFIDSEDEGDDGTGANGQSAGDGGDVPMDVE